MVNINKNCIVDQDCGANNICAFNEDDLNHYCIENNINKLYYGCLNINDFNKLQYIDSNSEQDHSNYLNCIHFSRRQMDENGMAYNYMIYKPKRKTFVDMTTINIYLKCNHEILAVIPTDFFNYKCNDQKDECILESTKTLINFIEKNTKNCNQNIYLEVIYLCENEGIQKKLNIPIDINNQKNVVIQLKCPINMDNDTLKSKCKAMYFNKYKSNVDTMINKNIDLKDCSNPIFQVPRIIKNPNLYSNEKEKNNMNEIKQYDKKIDEKVDELKKTKAEKYMKLKENQDGIKLTMEQALKEINNMSINKLLNSKNNWVFYENYDAAQNLFDNENSNLKYYGKVYTLDEAIKIANDLNENFFVWYHNSFELDNYASKLYFINYFNLDKSYLLKSSWTKHDNVTTGLFKLDLENFNENDDSLNRLSTELNNNNKILENNSKKLYDTKLFEQEINKNLFNNINKNMDSKITTYAQAISMNNYETNINNIILSILIVILIAIVIIFIFVLSYFSITT